MNAPPVQYVRTSDGYSIAYRVTGGGIPWVIVPPVFHHLEVTRQNVSIGAWIRGLAERFMLVEFDHRGQGLSSRGLSIGHSVRDLVTDVEAIVDHLNVGPAVLHANHSSGHTAVRFATSHPERVRALVLVACSVSTQPWPAALFDTLADADWDFFLRTVAGPGRNSVEATRSVERLRQTVTKEDFLLMFRTFQHSTIEAELKSLTTPTLVLHLRDAQMAPSLQNCADLATRIPNARRAQIDGGDGDTLWGDFASAAGVIDDFLTGLTSSEDQVGPGGIDRLSPREVEVLRLLAAGRSNAQIADELVISLNTVLRHVSNIFAKTGAANRTEAAVYARDHSLI